MTKPALTSMPEKYLEENISRLCVPVSDNNLDSKFLKEIEKYEYSIDDQDRARHGKYLTYHQQKEPDAVIYPKSISEVQEIVFLVIFLIIKVVLCSEYKVPIVPFGKGSSLEGHITALEGGISLDLKYMNQIISVNPEDLDITAQAGATRNEINAELEL